MIRRAFLVAGLAAAMIFGGQSAALAQSAKQGIVVQVSDDSEKTWNQALNVVRNIQAEYGKDKVDVELVVFGLGAGMLKFDATVANRVDETIDNGVKVLMCENSMRGGKLTRSDMHGRIGYVKAGVVELIEKQRQGWAVVRP